MKNYMLDDNPKSDPPVEANSDQPKAPPQNEGPPNAFWPGMTLNWNSPLVPLQLHVELPFWLLMPDGELSVSVEGCKLRVTVTQNAVEIQRGKFFLRSHANVIHVEKPPPSKKTEEIVKATKEGVTFRITRTLVTLHTRALQDAILALDEGERRTVDAHTYLQ